MSEYTVDVETHVVLIRVPLPLLSLKAMTTDKIRQRFVRCEVTFWSPSTVQNRQERSMALASSLGVPKNDRTSLVRISGARSQYLSTSALRRCSVQDHLPETSANPNPFQLGGDAQKVTGER